MLTYSTKLKFKKYIHHLVNQFSSILQDTKSRREHAYKIAGWVRGTKIKNDRLIYQVTGTDKFISNFSVLDIYLDDEILLKFSKQDIKYIITLANFLYHRDARYKIIWEKFENIEDGHSLKILDCEKSNTIKTKIEDLEKNYKIINQLHGRDAFNLGKQLGIRERIREEKFIRSC